MKGVPGFIVKVVPSKAGQICYQSNGFVKTLNPEDEFIGYFWQILNEKDGAKCHLANITRIVPRSSDSKSFCYADEAWFEMSDIETIVVALRGPKSNNRFLTKEYRAFETWDIEHPA